MSKYRIKSAEDATIALLSEILKNSPKLTGAACSGQSDLFDPRDPKNETDNEFSVRRHMALRACASCPARPACEQWAADLPRHRVAGILPNSDEPHTRRSMTHTHEEGETVNEHPGSPTPEDLLEARLTALALIERSDEVQNFKLVSETTEFKDWQLLISMAGLTRSLLDNWFEVTGTDGADYFASVRQWIISGSPAADDTEAGQ